MRICCCGTPEAERLSPALGDAILCTACGCWWSPELRLNNERDSEDVAVNAWVEHHARRHPGLPSNSGTSEWRITNAPAPEILRVTCSLCGVRVYEAPSPRRA